jgi:hypothetical protein
MNYKSDNFNKLVRLGFTIPVIVRVTDVNDNTPNFFDAPYLLNISELTIVGSRIFRNIKAIDADQPGPFSTVEYSIGESQVGNSTKNLTKRVQNCYAKDKLKFE